MVSPTPPPPSALPSGRPGGGGGDQSLQEAAIDENSPVLKPKSEPGLSLWLDFPRPLVGSSHKGIPGGGFSVSHDGVVIIFIIPLLLRLKALPEMSAPPIYTRSSAMFTFSSSFTTGLYQLSSGGKL